MNIAMGFQITSASLRKLCKELKLWVFTLQGLGSRCKRALEALADCLVSHIAATGARRSLTTCCTCNARALPSWRTWT